MKNQDGEMKEGKKEQLISSLINNMVSIALFALLRLAKVNGLN